MNQSPKQIAARQHNRLLGHTAMIKQNAQSIMNSPTTRDEAKALAYHIIRLNYDLSKELKENRVDP